jgi:Protein of unknown function (DUF2778)
VWTYEIATGQMLDQNGARLAIGYSGSGIGKNNTLYQHVPDVGPIPMGSYEIGPPANSAELGPHVMELTPAPLNEMYGRNGFFIHGDSISDPGSASDGCIVLPLAARQAISASGDNELEVVSGLMS